MDKSTAKQLSRLPPLTSWGWNRNRALCPHFYYFHWPAIATVFIVVPIRKLSIQDILNGLSLKWWLRANKPLFMLNLDTLVIQIHKPSLDLSWILQKSQAVLLSGHFSHSQKLPPPFRCLSYDSGPLSPELQQQHGVHRCKHPQEAAVFGAARTPTSTMRPCAGLPSGSSKLRARLTTRAFTAQGFLHTGSEIRPFVFGFER